MTYEACFGSFMPRLMLWSMSWRRSLIATHENSNRSQSWKPCSTSMATKQATCSFGHLLSWSAHIRRIALKVPGHSFRYAVEGAGLIQLYLDGRRDGVICHTHYGHWNEAGARERSMHSADDCDWQALAKLSGRIQRHIRNRLAAAKLHARPVLHQAFSAVERGCGLKFGAAVHHADSSDIHRV